MWKMLKRMNVSESIASKIAFVFSFVVGFVCLASFLIIAYFKIKGSSVDLAFFVDAFKTTFSCILGILVGFFGLQKKEDDNSSTEAVSGNK